MKTPRARIGRSLPAAAFVAWGLSAGACQKKTETEPQSESTTSASVAKDGDQAKAKDSDQLAAKREKAAKRRKEMLERLKQRGQRSLEAKPVAEVPVTAGDPEKGEFTLEEATANLKGDGVLVAQLETTAGTLSCELYEDKAPITVANFVGLARGLRPWQDGGKWVKKPLYDGTPFHRIIKGFMIQGGDPKGNGSGGPGYVIPDEVWANARHDERGLLCMANRGPNTNGSQFFIMDGKASHLDGGYTIFGKCGPDEVIEKIAEHKVRGDRAVDPPKIRKVSVHREAKKQEAVDPSSGSDAKPAAAGSSKAATPKAPAPKKSPAPAASGK